MPPPSPDTPDSPPPIAVIVSRYNASITDRLLEGAVSAYTEAGGGTGLAIIDAPGAFELPAIATAALQTGLYAGAVCLGCVIRGETTHDQHINHAVADALANLSVIASCPVGFGVLTCQSVEHAEARAGGAKGNKGAETMRAVLGACRALDALDHAAETETPGLRFTLAQGAPDKAGA